MRIFAKLEIYSGFDWVFCVPIGKYGVSDSVIVSVKDKNQDAHFIFGEVFYAASLIVSVMLNSNAELSSWCVF